MTSESCPHCGAAQGEGGGIAQELLAAWRTPRLLFMAGLLLGTVVTGSLLLSTPETFEPSGNMDIGDRVLHHYRSASDGVQYELVDVTKDRSGIYAVTLEVSSSTATDQKIVYVTAEGDAIFESAPRPVRTELSFLSD